MAGLGGAWLAIDIRAYNQDQVAGRGFQGLAALIFGNWRPAGIAAGAGLFAFAQSLTQRLGTAPVRALFLLGALIAAGIAVSLFARKRLAQAGVAVLLGVLALIYFVSSETVNNQIVFITPYLVTLLVLAFASQHLRPPAAEGRPWRKGDLGERTECSVTGDRLGGAAGGRARGRDPRLRRRTRTSTSVPRRWSTTGGSCAAATSRTPPTG